MTESSYDIDLREDGPRTGGRAPREVPISTRSFDRNAAIELFGSLASALCLTWVVFFRIVPLTGLPGFVLQAYLAFMLIYWLVVRQRHGRLAATDRIMAALVATVGLVVVGVLILLITSVVVKGLKALNGSFFTEDLSEAGPLSESGGGGALHSIIGSFQQVALALVISTPLAIATAVFLHEIGGRAAQPVRTLINAMSGVPSIVAGLFIYAVLIRQLGFGFSGLLGALALSILMMPSITRTTEEVLRLVPGGLREAALALGAPEWRATWKVVLPTARTGVITAVILGVARAIGETAPLLLTTFGSKSVNVNPFSDQQDSLPLMIWTSYRNASQSVTDRGWTAALVLVVIVLVLFTLARVIGSRGLTGGNRKKGRNRSRDRASEPDLVPYSLGIVPAGDPDRTHPDRRNGDRP